MYFICGKGEKSSLRERKWTYILYCVGRGIGRKNTEKGLRNDKRKKRAENKIRTKRPYILL